VFGAIFVLALHTVDSDGAVVFDAASAMNRSLLNAVYQYCFHML